MILDGGSGIDTSIFTEILQIIVSVLIPPTEQYKFPTATLRDGTTLLLRQSFIFNGTTYGEQFLPRRANLYGYLANGFKLLLKTILIAAQHYINHGYAEGRNTTDFNPTNYLNKYADLLLLLALIQKLQQGIT